ncbi:uncharacterized protein HMPREF1541_11080 [Cyphellophora europaea CBS 101466]|uniref:3'-5' exonuclease domain-containing protein n=1 Tax=Cyphellophora europaea (strain CBS 101466) TaxID=1220924 RepID=W2S7R6_CYPE1|nr:uncharacterized protein HMPREF1541_11080 [Cyphellophora europaea CBS 101466]ETN43949.1 hypothetical protein HMPREF1541_11080 [Cyphellophora europaea CBS 101466]
MPTKVIDNADSVREVVQEVTSRNKIPLIFIDLEGENLSRHGSIAIVSVLIPPNPTIYLLDVHELQSRAFDTAAAGGLTWRSILESEEHPKVFFDVRNDSDALYSHFSIALRGVVDLQLLEFATRPGRGRYVKGLSKCILESSFLSAEERSSWRRGKDEGIKQFAPEHGGTYRVFFKRPLSTALQSYCAEDVLKLPGLLSAYSGTIKPHLAAQVGEEALHRVTLSQGVYFNGKGKHMAVGPDFTWTM